MAIQITQSQYDTAKQTLRNIHIKLEILDYDYRVLDSIEGNNLSGNVQIDANSDIRRTCDVSFVMTDSSFNVEAGGRIWLDKLIKIYVGVDDIKTGEISWTNMGMYIINQPTYNYDAATHTLSFNGLDLMARLTGQRNGYIADLAGEDIALAETGQNVREVIIGILAENGFTKYVVDECRLDNGVIQDVPYDMEFNQGSTWYDMLSELRNILPNYQIYFDVDGVFHYEQIPSSADDPIMIDMDLWKENVISEQNSVDFENVKNAIEVYGVTHDTEFYSDETVSTVSGADITLTVDSEIPQDDYTEVGFTLPSDADGQLTINFNEWGAEPLINADGTRVAHLDANTYYVIMYYLNEDGESGSWQFLGHLQAQGYWEDNNPESPFYVGGSIGKILLPLYGGEYENIQSDDLALQRAKYEIYLHCRLNDTLQLTTVPIYWADVNWKVNYLNLDKTQEEQYIVQSIHTDLSEAGNQTWELSRFYPLYPTI